MRAGRPKFEDLDGKYKLARARWLQAHRSRKSVILKKDLITAILRFAITSGQDGFQVGGFVHIDRASKELEVSRVTVAKAAATLVAEGFLRAIPRSPYEIIASGGLTAQPKLISVVPQDNIAQLLFLHSELHCEVVPEVLGDPELFAFVRTWRSKVSSSELIAKECAMFRLRVDDNPGLGKLLYSMVGTASLDSVDQILAELGMSCKKRTPHSVKTDDSPAGHSGVTLQYALYSEEEEKVAVVLLWLNLRQVAVSLARFQISFDVSVEAS